MPDIFDKVKKTHFSVIFPIFGWEMQLVHPLIYPLVLHQSKPKTITPESSL